MLAALKELFRAAIVPLLFIGTIFAAWITIVFKVDFGLMMLIGLIPQPNIWYKLHDYPFGKDFIDILFFSVVLGIFVQKKSEFWSHNSKLILVFMVTSYLALWNASVRFSLPLPVSTSNLLFMDWKNYAQMICLYFLAMSVLDDKEKQRLALLLMAAVILFISIRSYRNFSGGGAFDYDKRVGGPFEAVGLGPNHLGAFIADYSMAILGLWFFEKHFKTRVFLLGTVLMSLHPLFFSYSRGAYLGVLGAITFLGALREKRLLIVVLVLALTWQTVLPVSVVDRVMMTKSESGELDNSAAHRVNLWNHAMDLFYRNPVFGVGFGAFGYTVPEGELTDTHNFYMKTLSEQGLVGAIFLFLILVRALYSGWVLFRTGQTDFQRGLGFGFLGTMISIVITNIFGDRWSYFVLGSYMWLLWGMVDRCIINMRREAVAVERSST